MAYKYDLNGFPLDLNLRAFHIQLTNISQNSIFELHLAKIPCSQTAREDEEANANP